MVTSKFCLPSWNQNKKRHCFPWSPTPVYSNTAGITVETALQKEKEPCWWRGQGRWRGGLIETEVKQEWTVGHWLNGEDRCCVRVCAPVHMSLVNSQTGLDITEEFWGQLGERKKMRGGSFFSLSFQFQLAWTWPPLSCLCFFPSEQSFQHNLFKVLILTTTLCLWAKREIISLLLKPFLKNSFTSSFLTLWLFSWRA